MKDIIGLWPLGLIVLLLIVVLVWDYVAERRHPSGVFTAKKLTPDAILKFKKAWLAQTNNIREDQLPDEGLSPKERQSFKK